MTATVRRRRLAKELKRLRDAARMTIEDAALAADVSKSALSRIENALVAAKVPVVRALLDAYGCPPDRQVQLIQLSREAREAGWWQRYNDVFPTALSTFIAFESEASSLRAYEQIVVPGLFQTPDYARAILQPRVSPEELDARIDARLKRQQRLVDMEVWALIEESVLTRPLGGRGTLREQLAHLLDLSSRPNITIQIIPHSIHSHPGLAGPFVILDFPGELDSPIGGIESRAGYVWLDKPEDMRELSRTYDLLRAIATSEPDSRILIQTLLQRMADDATVSNVPAR